MHLDRARPRSSSSNTSRPRRPCSATLPTRDTLMFERFFDESGGMQLVIHAPFGARINRAFGLALRKRFCRAFNFELQAAATEDAIVLSLGETHSFELDERRAVPQQRDRRGRARAGGARRAALHRRAGAGTRASRSRSAEHRAASARPRRCSAWRPKI